MSIQPRKGKLWVWAIMVLVVFSPVILIGLRFCVTTVPFGFVGVRSNLLGGGIEQLDLKPGYHMAVPGLHKVQLMDARKKIMNLGGAKGGKQGFPVTAIDQLTLWLDLTLVYSLEDDTGHLALRKYGEGDQFKGRMKVLAEKAIADVLSQMESKDFYDSQKRTDQAQKALDELNRRMRGEESRDYMTAHQLLIRNIVYPESFENRLLERQLLGQKQLLYEAKAKMEKELEKTQTIDKQTLARNLEIEEDKNQALKILQAQTDAEIAKIEAEAAYYAGTVLAEADRYSRERVAAGELAKTRAQAIGDQAANAAYAAPGGALLLVRRMVDSVSLGDIEINTNRRNPFDVYEMLDMLGARPEAFAKEFNTNSDIRRKATSILDSLKEPEGAAAEADATEVPEPIPASELKIESVDGDNILSAEELPPVAEDEQSGTQSTSTP